MPRLAPEKIAAIKDLARTGAKVSVIARELGMNYSTVYEVVVRPHRTRNDSKLTTKRPDDRRKFARIVETARVAAKHRMYFSRDADTYDALTLGLAPGEDERRAAILADRLADKTTSSATPRVTGPLLELCFLPVIESYQP